MFQLFSFRLLIKVHCGYVTWSSVCQQLYVWIRSLFFFVWMTSKCSLNVNYLFTLGTKLGTLLTGFGVCFHWLLRLHFILRGIHMHCTLKSPFLRLRCRFQLCCTTDLWNNFHELSQNCGKRLLATPYMSVLLHGTTRLPLDGFSWNLIFEFFSKICRENSSFVKIWQE